MGCCISKCSPKSKDFKEAEEPHEKYCSVPEKMFMSRCPSRVSPLNLPEKNRFHPIPVPNKFINIPGKVIPPPSPVKLASFSPIQPSTTSNYLSAHQTRHFRPPLQFRFRRRDLSPMISCVLVTKRIHMLLESIPYEKLLYL